MAGYIKGGGSAAGDFVPERLEELVAGDALVRVLDGFVAQLDVGAAGFIRAHCLVLGQWGLAGRDIDRAISCGFFETPNQR